MSGNYSDLVRRAALPEILFVPDVAVALQVSASTARRAVLRGDCGPYFRLGRRLAVRRASLLDALASRERQAWPRLLDDHEPGDRREP